MLDLMRWITGREFTRAAAFQSNVGSPAIGEMENNAAIAFELDNGGTASMRIDYLRPATAQSHGDDRLRIVGTRGIAEYKESRLTVITDSAPLVIMNDLPPARSLVVDFLESLYLRKEHILSAADIFRISEVVLKARDAADTGKIVTL
jgi:predicted dehydrogenase